MFSGGIEMEHWLKMGEWIKRHFNFIHTEHSLLQNWVGFLLSSCVIFCGTFTLENITRN